MSCRNTLAPALGILTPLLAPLLVACGEDDMVAPSAELTAEEATALFHAIEPALVPHMGVPEVVVIHESGDSIVVACQGGGNVHLGGSFSEHAEPDSVRYEWNLEVTPRNCEETRAGLTFIVDAEQGPQYLASVTIIRQTQIVIAGSLAGELGWSLEDTSGRCEIDLELAGELILGTPLTIRRVYGGSMCGHDIEVEVLDEVEVT